MLIWNINNNNKKLMKKLILITASMLIMSVNFAEYNVVIGKGLPQESIKFVNKTPPEPPQPVCKYSFPADYWLNGRNTAYSIVHVVDNSIYVHNGKDIYLTTHIIGNFKYTRGDFISNVGDYAHYKICKVAI